MAREHKFSYPGWMHLFAFERHETKESFKSMHLANEFRVSGELQQAERSLLRASDAF